MPDQLVDVLDLEPGDQIHVDGEWLTLAHVERYRRDFKVVLRTVGDPVELTDQHGQPFTVAGGRTFVADMEATRRARTAAA